jgi:hypothetical protein
VAHRTKLTKSQRAVHAANIGDGVAVFQPTQIELAKAFGVSVPMVQAAKRLSPSARQAVLDGKATLASFANKPSALKSLKMLANNLVANDDETLRAIIKRRGVDHVIDVTATMDVAAQ